MLWSPRSSGRLRAALVALVLLASGALAATASAATSRLVVTPRAGAEVTRTPLTVTIRAPASAAALRVTLNGVAITDRFSAPDRRGRRTLRASANDAIRYGRNVLAVRVGRAGSVRRARTAFTITRARPLVGAGRDRRVVAGRAVKLDGPPRARGPRPPHRVARSPSSAASATAGSRGRRPVSASAGASCRSRRAAARC
ncbi:hypothetical protein VSS74_12295 [Conexibacter stalactiti]|uniref:Uncharacterized protein n=1 Tax=Conexibacter stalactiti TaxID=1940611 RepID=A0ABU4HP96_9ACTN|nr:hypothetical protein [Conexibacter stalactiti]MDW5595123.1 hypothetical protein [Conexibacter stalactiti]MEC5035765.1 hypothetical protein [Conexibacter stalactiti]